ncbi:MAG: hypothetical protein IKU86_06685 [Thermoguttaceae bacterium]|nr:hypothetical protein [Thermoguttaceae bacterium]
MSFIDNFYDFVDLTERVDVLQNRDGDVSTFELDRAGLFSSRFSNGGANDVPPRIVGVWRLPLDENTRSIRRGDKIRDAEARIWIVSETSPSQTLQLLTCQCFCEQLFPGPSDFINASRPLRSGGFETIATQAPALVKRRTTSSLQNAAAFPALTLVEEIEFWIRIDVPLRPNDVVATSDGNRYETTSYRSPDDVSDWGVLVARRLGGADDFWRSPKPN